MPCCRQNSCRVKPLSRHWPTRVNMYSLRSLISIIFGRKTTADQLLRKYVLGRADTVGLRQNNGSKKAGVSGVDLSKVACSSPPSLVPHPSDIPVIPVYISIKRPKDGTLSRSIRQT